MCIPKIMLLCVKQYISLKMRNRKTKVPSIVQLEYLNFESIINYLLLWHNTSQRIIIFWCWVTSMILMAYYVTSEGGQRTYGITSLQCQPWSLKYNSKLCNAFQWFSMCLPINDSSKPFKKLISILPYIMYLMERNSMIL